MREGGPPSYTSWPLVGRQAELDYATGVLNGAGAVVIAGAGGVGKSRLLNALAEAAVTNGWRIERCSGTTAAAVIPLGAVAHLVPPSALAAPREGLLAAVVAAITERRDDKVLVCVDDAHLLDPASAALVGLLVGHAGPGVAVAVTIRSGEPAPDAIVALWKESLAPRLEVLPLSRDEVDVLTTAVLGGRLDRASLHLLWERTAGNVLFLRELVADGLERSVLTEAGGVWRWHGPITVGPTLSELISARLSRLDDAQRAALEAVAVGEPLPIESAERVIGSDLLDALERDGLVEVRAAGSRRTVQVGHPLFGEAMRAALPVRRADRLRVAVAEALEAVPGAERGDLLRAAALRVDAGAPAEQERLVEAAREASVRGDPALVERLAAAALQLGQSPEAHFLMGRSLEDLGRHDEALDCWNEVLEDPCTDEVRTLTATGAARVLAFSQGRPAEAEALLAAAERVVTSRDSLGRLAATRAALFFDTVAEAELEDAVTPMAEGDDEARVWTWIGSARARLAAGQLHSVLEESELILAPAPRASAWPLAVLYVGALRYFGFFLGGRLDDAEALARSGVERALGYQTPFARAIWMNGLGTVALARGHLDEASSHLVEVAELLRCNDNGGRRVALHDLGLVRALEGDATGALACLAEADDANRGIIEPLVDAARVRAAVVAGQGSTSEARGLVREAAGTAQENRQAFSEALALHDLARLGGAAEASPRLSELAAGFEGIILALYADQARALAAGDARALLDTSTRFRAAGYDLDGAESACAASRVLREAGDATAATAADRTAETLLAACGTKIPRTPLLAERVLPVALTEREREVAGLAATGVTDAEIATRLYLSVRTVHAHLRSVYAKLGVSTRRDLARALDGSAAE